APALGCPDRRRRPSPRVQREKALADEMGVRRESFYRRSVGRARPPGRAEAFLVSKRGGTPGGRALPITRWIAILNIMIVSGLRRTTRRGDRGRWASNCRRCRRSSRLGR